MIFEEFLNLHRSMSAVAIAMRVLPLPGGITAIIFFFEPACLGKADAWQRRRATAIYYLFGA